jgi:hypothetical protein
VDKCRDREGEKEYMCVCVCMREAQREAISNRDNNVLSRLTCTYEYWS